MTLEELCKDPDNKQRYLADDPEFTDHCDKCGLLTKGLRCLAFGYQQNMVSIQEARDCDAFYPADLMYFKHYERTPTLPKKSHKDFIIKFILTLLSLILILGGITQL